MNRKELVETVTTMIDNDCSVVSVINLIQRNDIEAIKSAMPHDTNTRRKVLKAIQRN